LLLTHHQEFKEFKEEEKKGKKISQNHHTKKLSLFPRGSLEFHCEVARAFKKETFND